MFLCTTGFNATAHVRVAVINQKRFVILLHLQSSIPSQMSRLLVMSMEPCAAWRLRRFEKFFAAKDPFDVMCQCGLLKYHDPTKNKKVKSSQVPTLHKNTK